MDLLAFIERFGREQLRMVATSSGTSYAYLMQIAYGHRRPSVELADRLIAASGGYLTFNALLRSKQRKTPSIPSAAVAS